MNYAAFFSSSSFRVEVLGQVLLALKKVDGDDDGG
jgi:hypothetical protein